MVKEKCSMKEILKTKQVLKTKFSTEAKPHMGNAKSCKYLKDSFFVILKLEFYLRIFSVSILDLPGSICRYQLTV